ncbi:MAG: sporulation initiation factor Spo0A C-terminal domain-containing protein, partial [Clostridiales bacterium]|nr:sporulation initiation factor Spo0A C-terminal domain-containing protein [Clostridiales bacterium]
LRIPALMDSLRDGLYARVAERCSASPASVERDIRYAIGQCWDQMEARQRRALTPHGTNRPAPKLFLTQLLRRLSQQQRETEALWPSAVPHEKAPLAPSVYRKRRSK